MTAIPVIYDGTGRPQPEQRALRAGPLDLVYEAGDLRYVRLGGMEVCRRWYAAVRDADWGTVPGVITDEVIEKHPDSFRVRYTSTHRQGDIHFVWHADISGDPNGTLRFEFDGEAKTAFRRNRIGFCILHPIRECAGARAKLLHPDGSTTDTEFPRLIAPQNPFKELVGLSHEVAPGVWAEWTFDGDVFETEDQRNWTDASFKTFCTPLRLPFPVEIPTGTRVRQVVTLTVRGTVPAEPQPAVDTFSIGARPSHPLPQIGLGVASHGRPLSMREWQTLYRLRPAHLRVDLDLTAGDYRDRLVRAKAEAESLGATLELAVTVSDRIHPEVLGLLIDRAAGDVGSPIGRVLAFHAAEWATPERIVAPVFAAAVGWGPVPVYVGTSANFTELNRGRPPLDLAGGVCFSIHPQVHAFDNRSLVETCAALADVVESARAFCGTLPLAVTPVTLKARVNPYATGPARPTPPGELPPQVDVRQMSLFGAAWTLAALKYLAESGVASATFYETTGWLGVMERDDGCPLPDEFPSRPGQVFPLYHVLADANQFAGCRTLPSRSSDPLAFDGLALRRDDSLRVMLANLTDRPRAVTVSGLGREAWVRTLDETNPDRAVVARADDNRVVIGDGRTTDRSTLTLHLRPYAYVCLDTTVPA